MKVLYKLVAILLALAVIPAAVFAPFVKIVVTSKAMSILGGSEVVLDESYSLYDGSETFFKAEDGKEPLNIKAFIGSLPENTKKALAPNFIAFLICFVLVLAIALVIVILVLASRKKTTIFILSGFGLLATILMNVFFNRFAAPLISGVIPITDLLTADLLSHFVGGGLAAIGGLLGSLLGGTKLVDVRLLSLSTAYILMLISYIASMVWSLSHALIESR